MYRGEGAVPMVGKVALITGSSSGIGQATAVELGRKGCSVSITGRNEEKLNKTKQLCIEAGIAENKILITIADVTKEDELKNLFDRTINNAGMLIKGNSINGPIEGYQQIMDTNLKSVIILTKLCLEQLKINQGCVVNMSSIASVTHNPDNLYYGMSKAALDYLTKVLAIELAPHGVRVNSVNPAFIDTPIFETALGLSAIEKQQMFEIFGPAHPLGRIGQPEEVAKAVSFLVSDQASFTTGQLLFVDGGVAAAGLSKPPTK